MQCSRCQRDISEEEAYVHQHKVFCEDCLMDIGLSVNQCDPWASYVDTRTRGRQGLKGAEGLTEMERKVYDLVKSRGQATRGEVMAALGLTETELRSQLIPLMHSELVKERSEAGQVYLVSID